MPEARCIDYHAVRYIVSIVIITHCSRRAGAMVVVVVVVTVIWCYGIVCY